MASLDVLLRDLARPDAYPEADWGDVPHAERRVEVVQTHISVVFLTARRAYKVKKPVRLWGLVDYGTAEVRRHWCEEEVRLNRRLAPDLYLGVVDLMGEPAVLMRRFRPADTLEALVAAGRADAALLRSVGQALAAFHAKHRLDGEAAQQLRATGHPRVLRGNLRATRGDVPELWPAALHRGLEHELARGLCAVRATLRSRLAPEAGEGVDGHGDLKLEHVLVEDGRLSVIDTVEFTTALRHVDPLSDLAFLWMDLLAHGERTLADALRDGYGRPGADARFTSLLLHFASYRAHVRAKVYAAMSIRTRAREHLVLAWSLARRQNARTPPLVLLRGPSGSGKSVLASALAPWLDAVVVQSDRVRKGLFGYGPLERPVAARVPELYGSTAGERTYAEVLRRGLATVRSGHAALLDATYLLERARATALDAARRAGVPCLIVDVTCPPDVVRERLRARSARGDDPSDAGVEVYEEQLRTAEPLTPAESAVTLAYAAGDDPVALLVALAGRVAAPGDPEGRPSRVPASPPDG